MVDVADAAIAGIAGARVAGIGGIQCAGDGVVGPAAADGSSGRVGGVGGKTEVGCEQLAVHQSDPDRRIVSTRGKGVLQPVGDARIGR